MVKTKKVMALMLIAILLFSIWGCAAAPATPADPGAAQPETAANDESAANDNKIRIGLILPSGRGDLSIGDALYNAVASAQEMCDFEFDYAEVVNPSDPEYFLREFAASGDYDLIIVGTFTFFDAMSIVPQEYPDQKFLAWDMSGLEGDNITYGCFKHEETNFVAGAFAALLEPYGEVKINGETYKWTPSGKFGTIIAHDNPIEMAIHTGYEAGIRYINPAFSCARGYTASYSDQAKAKELALSMYDSGANILMMGAGGACYGMVEAAKELGDGHWCIGFDQNNNGVDVHVIASALNETTPALASQIVDFVTNGIFKGGATNLYGYTTGNQKLAMQDGIEVPPEVMEALEKIIEQVSNGEIDIPATYEEMDAFSVQYQG